MTKATFAERLKLAIENANINQSELAEKINVHRSTITHYLTGRYEPRHDRVDQFARALNVSPVWLMGFDVPMERESSSSDDKKEKRTPNIQSELEMFINRLDPSTGLAFFNGETEMDQETRELILMSLKNTLALSQKLSQNKEKQNED